MKRDAERVEGGCRDAGRATFGAARAMRSSSTIRSPKHAAPRVALVLTCVLLAVACMSGCRISDALTEVIYDQTSEKIDYDNPTKIYVNDSTAKLESDKFAAKEVSDDTDVVSDTVQNLVVYSSDPNTQGFTAKKSVFSSTPDFRGIEASEEVCFVKSDDPEAYDHPLTVEEPEDEPEEEEEPPEEQQVVQAATQPQDRSTTSPSPTTQTTPTETQQTGGSAQTDDFQDDPWDEVPEPQGEASQGDSQGDESPQTDNQPPAPQETDEGGGNDNGDTDVAYDAADPTAEPPKVDSIAAFGPAATIVQMLGGSKALAATDADTLASSFATVFDTSEIVVGFSGDGSDPEQMNVDAIIQSGAKIVLVYAGTYFSSLSESDQKKLSDAGVTQAVLYPMNSSGNIKQDVLVVGDMLSEAAGIQYAGQTAQRAAQYVSFHDEVVNAAANANGGLAGTQVFESGSDSVPAFDTDQAVYTLLIDEFDSSATYTGNAKSGWVPQGGLAFASAGYGTTPVSYYIQAGGLVNNAAEKTNMGDSGKVVAWQFMDNAFPFNPNQWSGSSTTANASSPDDYSLLTTTVNLHAMFPFGSSFGSSWFPKIIVTSPDIETNLINNSINESGVYHPYPFITAGANAAYSMFGPTSSIPSCIGFDGSQGGSVNLLDVDGATQIHDENVVVNPKGLFSDWTEGTVESFLEAAWVCDVVKGDSPVGWQEYVNRFYSDFYGYSLTSTDWNTMNPEGA